MSTPPTGVWLIAGTPVSEPYPCRCSNRQPSGRQCPVASCRCPNICHPKWCTCSGRTDLENVPATCCARFHTPHIAHLAQSI